MTPVYSCSDLHLDYSGADVVALPRLDLTPASFVAIVGPNGAGKSTLLATLAGLRSHYRGSCLLDGREVRNWPRRQLARQAAYLPQRVELAFPFTAEQVVWMGRAPHCGGLFDAPDDARAVDEALALTDSVAFRHRDFRALSGGERQRVLLASALVQSSRILLLDEPATSVDLKHQLAIYHLLRDLARRGALVVAVTHDLALARAFPDRVIVLQHGRPAADGPPATALGPQTLSDVFEIDPAQAPWFGGSAP